MRIERYLQQDLTYWAPLVGDDGFGNQLLSGPQAFLGRWVDKQETTLSSKGEEILSKATVYFPSYLTPEPDGWICKGKQTSTTPASLSGAWIIRNTNAIPDLRNLNTINVAII